MTAATDAPAGVFADAEPFPHMVLDDWIPRDLWRGVYDSLPPANDPAWVHYRSGSESKRACRDIHLMGDPAPRLFWWLQSFEFIRSLEQLTGIEGLLPDPTLHGGGIHCSDRGGRLGIHIDYALHPRLELERKLNLVAFLNPEWNPSWGGELELWNADATECVKRILPQPGRVVIWRPSDTSFHGQPVPVECPGDVTRTTAAVYYLGEPAPGVTRKRALFVPDRG